MATARSNKNIVDPSRLNGAEKEMLAKSVASVQTLIDACKSIDASLA